MDKLHTNIVENIKYNTDTSLTENWSLQKTLFGATIVVLVYLTTVLKILPQYMVKRNPYKMKTLLTFYNIIQVLYSCYLVYVYTRYSFKHGIIITRCPQGSDMKEVISDIFPYFIAKHLDLLDTVFFVLRKKNNQVTFLHLYHHSAMVTWLWLCLLYHPTDHFVIVGLLNSFVHVLMYAYYAISSLGPKYSKFVWWKRHLTKIQLVQFILVITDLHYQQKLAPCKVPLFFHYFCVMCIGSFFFLFLHFYFMNYRKKNLKSNERNTKTSSNGNIDLFFKKFD